MDSGYDAPSTPQSSRSVSSSSGGDWYEGEGWVAFAGIMIAIVGILNFIYGIAAISNSHFYVHEATYTRRPHSWRAAYPTLSCSEAGWTRPGGSSTRPPRRRSPVPRRSRWPSCGSCASCQPTSPSVRSALAFTSPPTPSRPRLTRSTASSMSPHARRPSREQPRSACSTAEAWLRRASGVYSEGV